LGGGKRSKGGGKMTLEYNSHSVVREIIHGKIWRRETEKAEQMREKKIRNVGERGGALQKKPTCFVNEQLGNRDIH